MEWTHVFSGSSSIRTRRIDLLPQSERAVAKAKGVSQNA
jgi:hypothetical protein